MPNSTAILAIWPLDAIGPHEWIIIAVAAVILFGSRLPELGRMLGRSIVEFKKGVRSMQEEMAKASNEVESNSQSTASGDKQSEQGYADLGKKQSTDPGQNS